MAAPSSDAERLIGSWRLISIQVRMEDTEELLDLYGPDPRGTNVFGAGRMATIVSASGRAPPADDTGMAAVFRGMVAYSGRYTVEQDQIVTVVDVSWLPEWENTRQTRSYKLEGDRLTLTSEVRGHPSYPGRWMRSIVDWAREP
jgi:Lipocalin-like domain